VSPVDAIALSGMIAATLKLTASASNLVNAEDETRVGAPGYQPLRVQNTTAPGGGVTAVATTVKPASFFAFDPSSPVANVQGLVAKPEIDPVEEVSNQLQAGHAFAFSLEALKAKDEAEKTLLDLKT
jgi:flagellar basal-body rod protein FlgC